MTARVLMDALLVRVRACVCACVSPVTASGSPGAGAGAAATGSPHSAGAAVVAPVATVKPSRRYTGHLYKQGGGSSLFGKKNWKVGPVTVVVVMVVVMEVGVSSCCGCIFVDW